MVDLHKNCWMIDFSEVELDSPMRDVAKLLSVLLFQLTVIDNDEAVEDGKLLIDSLLESAKQQGHVPSIPKVTIRSMKAASMRMAASAFTMVLRLVWARMQDAVP